MDLPVCTPILHTHHIFIPDIRMSTILDMEFPYEYFASFLQLSCHSFSFFTPFLSICPSLLLCPLLPPQYIDVFVSFSTTLTQVREGNGSLALTLQSTRAASQPFTVHLNSRLLPPGDNTATGECIVCNRSRNGWKLALMMQIYART